MPQINTGKTVPAGKPLPFNAGDILTAADLNQMMDSATLAPEAITAQTNFTTLTGDEHTIIFDPASGQLRKTQLKNITLTGEDVATDNVLGKSINGTLVIQPQGSTSSLNIYGGSVGGSVGTISGYAKNINLTAQSSVDNTGAFNVVAGTDGMSFNSGNAAIEFLSRVELNTTNAVRLPIGTTAQRPATAVAGDTRFNSTTNKLEFYNGTAWTSCVDNATGSITGMLLYDVYEEGIGYAYGVTNGVIYWTSSAVTKPANEIWVVEFDFIYQCGSSGQFYIHNSSITTPYKTIQVTNTTIVSSSSFVVASGTALTSEQFVLYRGAIGSSGSTVAQIAHIGAYAGDNKMRIYKYKPV